MTFSIWWFLGCFIIGFFVFVGCFVMEHRFKALEDRLSKLETDTAKKLSVL